MPSLQIVVVSGLSGSGKSVALNCFEDLGFFCIDNLPPPLLPTFINLCAESSHHLARIALGIDIREGVFLEDFIECHRQLVAQGHDVVVLFLEAQETILLRRFSESRRPHPLAVGRPVREGIESERQQLAKLRAQADWVVDTSHLTVHQLKAVIAGKYRSTSETKRLQVTLLSFGYKHGLPGEVDLVFDLRCLPNPHFDDTLRELTGESEKVDAYLFGHAQANAFIDQLRGFLDFVLPQYEQEGRAHLTIGLGCTGGRHRSVAMAIRLARHLADRGFQPVVRHRDISAPPA